MQIFEKWRVADTTKLEGSELAEFEQDREESNRRYNEAFDVVLSHTSTDELDAFWAAFGGESASDQAASNLGDVFPAGDSTDVGLQTFANPMHYHEPSERQAEPESKFEPVGETVL